MHSYFFLDFPFTAFFNLSELPTMDFLPVFVVDMRPDWFMMEDGRPTVEDDLPATSDL